MNQFLALPTYLSAHSSPFHQLSPAWVVYNKTQKVIEENGRDSDEARKQLEKLGEAFCSFKLVPKHYDEIVDMARDALDTVRRHERSIMTSVVRHGRVPRDVFRKNYVGNETSVAWINKLVKAEESYSAGLELQREDIFISESTFFYDGGGCCWMSPRNETKETV